MLIEEAVLNTQNQRGQTALHVAADTGIVDIVQTLLANGYVILFMFSPLTFHRADARIWDVNKQTPVALANAKGYTAVINLLLQRLCEIQ